MFEITITYIVYIVKMKILKLICFFCLPLCIFLTSCTSLKKGNSSSVSKSANIDPQDITLFEEAFKNLGEENYARALPIFEKLAKKYQGWDLEWAALYNMASSYKELKQCERAENIYQTLLSRKNLPLHLKPHIYLSLSYTYECLGQKTNTLIALREGRQYLNHLPVDIRLIEYPARLSLAYIRMDEDQTGLKMQKQVYQNLEIVKKTFRISSAADKNFSQYFYIIGRSYIRTDHIQLHQFLKMFLYYQAYLTQSVLLNSGKWSIKAERELGDLYRKMWVALKKQKNKKVYQPSVKKVLNQLKNIERNSKDKRIRYIYLNLRKKTLAYLE